MIFDHVITMDEPFLSSVSRDWYSLHVFLSHTLGERVDAEGRTKWLFASDPRADSPSVNSPYVVVRTFDAEAFETMRELEPYSTQVHIPQRGEVAAFHLAVSSREGRPSFSRRLTRHNEGRTHIGADVEGNYGEQLDRVEALLARAGLELIDGVDGFASARFRIRRGHSYSFSLLGLFAEGRAKVLDELALTDAIVSGVGRDKTYGFGLLIPSKIDASRAAA